MKSSTFKIYSALSVMLLCSLSMAAEPKASKKKAKANASTDVKAQKYNGYGLPNTKFKKLKVDLTKKTTTELQAEAAKAPVPPTMFSPAKPVTTSVASSETKPAESIVKPGLALNSSYNMQAEAQDKGVRSEYILHEIDPSLKIAEYTLLGVFYYIDDLKNPSANEWQDSSISLSRKGFETGRYLTIAPFTNVTLPLSKASRETAGAKYSLGAGAVFGLNTKNLNLEALTLAYSVSYTKMTTEYETSTKGEPVTSYRIRQRVNLYYSFTEKFSIKTRFQLDSAYSTQNVTRNYFLHFQYLEYQFTPNFSMNIGHANAAGVYNIEERQNEYILDNNIKFYDQKTSEYAIGIGLSI